MFTATVFSIILELLVILEILKFDLKFAFKEALNVNLTHLLYVAMLPHPNFSRKVKSFSGKAIKINQ